MFTRKREEEREELVTSSAMFHMVTNLTFGPLSTEKQHNGRMKIFRNCVLEQ